MNERDAGTGSSPPKQTRRAQLSSRLRTFTDQQLSRLARSTGLRGEAGAAIIETMREFQRGLRLSWRLTDIRAQVSAAASRGLDRMSGIVARVPMSIPDVDTLDHEAGVVRHGVFLVLSSIQGLLAVTTASTEGAGGPPSIVIDAAVAQVASLITGLAEWYLVGSYAMKLLEDLGVKADPATLRLIVNATLLSRSEHSIDERFLGPGAERRLIVRWVGRGVVEALPVVSGFPSRRVRRAGTRLEQTDLRALIERLGKPVALV